MTKFSLIAAVAASLTIVAAPAMAEDFSVAVPYGDLDVATPAGAQLLAQRVDAGADSACARPDMRNLKAMVDFNACKSAAVAGAQQQLAAADATPAVALS